MTAPTREIRVTHLLVADEALDTSWWGGQAALCGEEVRDPSTPADPNDWAYPNYRYCSDCVASAVRWQADRSAAEAGAR